MSTEPPKLSVLKVLLINRIRKCEGWFWWSIGISI